MKYALGFVLWLATISGALADGVPSTDMGATWSTVNGGTVAMVRNGKTFDAKPVGADYEICNDTDYVPDPKGTDQFDKSLTIDTPAKVSSAILITPAKDGQSGIRCGCLYNPPNVLFRSGFGRALTGRYKAFPPGSACQGKSLTLGVPEDLVRECEVIDRPNLGSGSFGYWRCDIYKGKRSRLVNIRLCSNGASSFVDQSGMEYSSSAYAVVDEKLVKENINGVTGQPLFEYSPVFRGCVDFYNVEQLTVIVQKKDGEVPNSLTFKNAQMFKIGRK